MVVCLRGLVVLEGVRVVCLRGVVVLDGVRVVLRGLVPRRVLLAFDRVLRWVDALGRRDAEGRALEDDRPRDVADRFDVVPRCEDDALLEDAGLALRVLEEALDRWTCVGPLLNAGTLKLNAATKETKISWYFKHDIAFTLQRWGAPM